MYEMDLLKIPQKHLKNTNERCKDFYFHYPHTCVLEVVSEHGKVQTVKILMKDKRN